MTKVIVKREVYHDWKRDVWDMAATAVKDYQRNNMWGASYYLWYRPSAGKEYGAVKIAADKPQGFELAWNERLSPARSYEALKYDLVEIMGRLPILPSTT